MQPESDFVLFDPKTILESLRDGDTNVFSPILDADELPELVFDESISWQVEDFMMIAEALTQKVWNDNLHDWKLYEMRFLLDCQDTPVGFEKGYLSYFKEVPRRDYAFREFFIFPKYGYVNRRGGQVFSRPLIGGWKSIDLDDLTINAVAAIRIAEENGGKDIRRNFDNNCSISLSLSPEKSTDGWRIEYKFYNLPEFWIVINPLTGEIVER
jgi:hypothetical protein